MDKPIVRALASHASTATLAASLHKVSGFRMDYPTNLSSEPETQVLGDFFQGVTNSESVSAMIVGAIGCRPVVCFLLLNVTQGDLLERLHFGDDFWQSTRRYFQEEKKGPT